LNHKKVIKKLDECGTWHITSQVKSLTMTRIFNGRDITVILQRENNGMYTLSHPGYDYVSTNSHFSSTIGIDKRLCLNKNLLHSLVSTLRKAEVWPLIANKQFLKLNDNNKSVSVKQQRISKELEDLLL
jgi:hypothetical protein